MVICRFANMIISNNTLEPKPKASTIALVLSNIVPLVGVVFLGWDLKAILFLYWSESAIIGLYTILKIFLSIWLNEETKGKKFSVIFLIPFFIFHYGFFMYAHLFFLVILFQIGTWNEGSVDTLKNLYFMINGSIVFSFLSLLVSHGVSFVSNYLKKKEYMQKNSFLKAMVYPYGRIFIMHIVIIIGGVLILFLGSKLFLLILLVVMKTSADLFSHLRVNKYFSSAKFIFEK